MLANTHSVVSTTGGGGGVGTSSEGQGREEERCKKSCRGQCALLQSMEALLPSQALLLVSCHGTSPSATMIKIRTSKQASKFGRKLCLQIWKG